MHLRSISNLQYISHFEALVFSQECIAPKTPLIFELLILAFQHMRLLLSSMNSQVLRLLYEFKKHYIFQYLHFVCYWYAHL